MSRIRASCFAILCAIVAVSSAEPSSMTSNSQSETVCACTDAIEASIVCATLYAGIITDTHGVLPAFVLFPMFYFLCIILSTSSYMHNCNPLHSSVQNFNTFRKNCIRPHMIETVRLRIARTVRFPIAAWAAWLMRSKGCRIVTDRMPTARRGTAEHDHERNARHCRNMCAARIDTDEEIQLSIERRKLHEVCLAAEVFDGKTDGGNHVLSVGIVPWCPRHVECRIIA